MLALTGLTLMTAYGASPQAAWASVHYVQFVQERGWVVRGLHFWAAGSCVSTVGLDEARVRQYIREQAELERRQGEFDFEEPLRPQGGLPDVLAPAGATGRNRPLWGALLRYTTASGRETRRASSDPVCNRWEKA